MHKRYCSSDLRHSSGVNLIHTVAQFVYILCIVRSEKNRPFPVSKLFEKLSRFRNTLFVKAIHWFVKDHQHWIFHNYLGYTKLLPHAK